jgi:hypothetical protein
MDREAIEEAIEVLEDASAEMLMETGDKNYYIEAIAVLRQALETEQEPVAWANSFDLQNFDMKVRTCPDLHHTVPLYTAPPKRELTCVCGAVWEGETMVHSPREREWVGLREDEIFSILENLQTIYNRLPTEDSRIIFAQAIEAKLKEKNT